MLGEKDEWKEGKEGCMEFPVVIGKIAQFLRKEGQSA